MNRFYIVLGDWSHDGHNVVEKVLIESNISMDKLHEAYKKSCEKTGISFDCNSSNIGKKFIEICVNYEEFELTEEIKDVLEKFGCKIDEMKFEKEEDEKQYFNSESFINVLMWFIGLSIEEEFIWKKLEDEIPCFNGYWQKELNVTLGYGLFN